MKPVEQSGIYPALADVMGADRAAMKLRATRRGWWLVAVGALIGAGAFGLVIGMTVFTKAAPATPLLIFAALLAVPGGLLILAGGHLIAGDAMRAAEQSGNLLSRAAARVLSVARPKGPPA